jgi:hypothetical protein
MQRLTFPISENGVMTQSRRLQIGSFILATAALSLLPASWAIAHGANLSDRIGRHLLAGSLANFSLAVLLGVIALVPLRRGERWAFWVFGVPLLAYGFPILAVDAMHVARSNLLMTLTPQILGLSLLLIGVVIIGPAILATRPQ